jgi:hypothetical protein
MQHNEKLGLNHVNNLGAVATLRVTWPIAIVNIVCRVAFLNPATCNHKLSCSICVYGFTDKSWLMAPDQRFRDFRYRAALLRR